MKKLSRLLLVLTLVLLIGCTSVLLVACDDDTDQGPAPTTPSFRVSFMKNYPESGEEDVAFTNVTVRQGRTVSAYEITEDDRPAGYDFVGWFVEKDGDEKFDFATKITQNVKIYAHWTENGKTKDVDLKGDVFAQEKVKIKTKEGEKEVDNGVWRYGGADYVIPHDNSRFDFNSVLDQLNKASEEGRTEFTVWKDEECSFSINNDPTNLVVNLKNGDNVYYIKAVAEDSKVTAVYKINVYLEPKYDVRVIRIQGNYESMITISDVAKGQKATAPVIDDSMNVGHTFDDDDGWYYYSEEKRNAEGQIVDADEDSDNILVKVGDKYYLADENGNRRFAYEDENGRKVVRYKGAYYLTDKSGARTNTKIEEEKIYNRLDENGYPVYDEGKPIKVGSKTEYKWDFDINVIDREDITVFGKWKTNTYNITLKISDEDRAKGAEFVGTKETKLLIKDVMFGSTAKAVEQLVNNKIGELTDSSRPVTKPHATFAGWYYNEIKVVDENGNGVHAFDFAENIDLVAKFNAETYKIVVNANDDSMMQEVTGSNDAWPYDQKATFTANPKDGYTLVRWLLNDKEHKEFGKRNSVEYEIKENDAINKTITFTAVFEPKDINVTLVSDVDDYGKTFVVKYNSDVALGQDAIPDVPKLSNDGTKRFIGWYIDGTKTYVVKYNVNKNEILVGKWAFTEDVTLIAEWLPYEFNITIYEAESTILPNIDIGNIIDNSGGSDWKGWTTASPLNLNGYRTEGHQKKFVNGAPLNFTAVTTNPKHYKFEGWYKLDENGKPEKDPCWSEATLPIKVEEKDVAYVAKWKYKEVTINFDRGTALENETTLPEQVKVDFNAPFTLSLPQGAPKEMTFDGWWHIDEGKGINYQYTGADGKNLNDRTFKDPRIFDDYNGTITLTAKWKKINYFIIEDGVIKGIDVEKAKNKDDKKFEIDFDDGVFEIADGAFKNNWFIKEITIQGNIQAIGEDAFANSVIEKIVFKGSFKGLAIGAGAFRNTRITNIKLPDNVTELGDNVFEGCLLTELWYSAEIPLGRLFTTENPNDTNNWYSAVQGGVTYYLPNKLTTIVVTNTATALADYAFQNASKLTKVTLATAKEDKPYTTEIGNYAFANTGSIEVNLGSVEIIGNAAFRNSGIATFDNNGVATVKLTALKKLGVDAFNGTTNVTDVSFAGAPIDNVSARAFANSSIKSVDLGSIKIISMSAFANSGLESVSSGNGVKTIKTKAFFKSNISSVSGFVNVENIEKEAFHDTQYFTNSSGILIIGKVLYSAKEGGTIEPNPNVVSIAPEAFTKSNFTTVDLSGYTSLKYIESYAFAGSNISTVKLPASLMVIKDSAFRNAKALKSVDFSACENLTSIWPYAFADCTQLNELIFKQYAKVAKDTLTLSINAYAFSGCVALTSVKLPENLKELGAYAFAGCKNIKTIEFITNAQLAEEEAGEGGDSNPKYEKDNLITAIGDGAFMGCTSLKEITLPYIVASIGNSAFEKCTALVAFTTMKGADSKKQPAALRTIGDRAFFGSTSLNNIDVNTTKGVNTIGVSAFENCEQLATINLSGVTKFAEGVFRNAKALKSVTMSANASIYVGQEAFRNCVTLSDITARIAAVDDGAFRNCISLRAITFVSSGIEYIGSNAFNGCVLIQKVSIPSSVVAIGDSAFDGCRGITSLTFESNETLQTIGYSAFGGCSLLTRVILPSSLVELNATAFYGCSDLEYVEFGENIQTVGEDAFALCKNGLVVRFTGKTVPVFMGDIFTATENVTISVRQGYRATFEAVLGTNKYKIVEYTA